MPPALLYTLVTVGAALIIVDSIAFGARMIRRARAAEKHASRRPAPTARCAEDADATRLVLEPSRGAAEQTGPSTVGPDDRKRRLAALIDGRLDRDAVGDLLHGSHWPRATPQQKAGLLNEFRADLIRSSPRGSPGSKTEV
jgi:hypothetical protein